MGDGRSGEGIMILRCDYYSFLCSGTNVRTQEEVEVCGVVGRCELIGFS
jgi:hypothetical protein